jgi:hypothetical protein
MIIKDQRIETGCEFESINPGCTFHCKTHKEPFVKIQVIVAASGSQYNALNLMDFAQTYFGYNEIIYPSESTLIIKTIVPK